MNTPHNQPESINNQEDELDALHFITHELKNTVIGIVGLAKLLMRTEEDPDRKEKLETIRYHAKHLETMSARFLLASQLEQGQIEICAETIDDLYEEVIRPVLSILSRNSASPFSECQKQMDNREPIEVTADKNLLRVVFQNILGNALKYRDADGRVSFDVKDLGDKYRLNVWNSGPGVAPDETDRIFDKFYRAADTATRDTKGSGLGLYNTRQIVEAHNGELWCETEPGKWINFVFTLPKK
jgi:signal transduction histidine kinase